MPDALPPPAHDPPEWLLGTWRLLRADPSLEFAGGVRVAFRAGGEMEYRIPVEGREMVARLVYRLEGDVLRTHFPAGGHAATTRLTLGAGGVLRMDFAGALAWFVREER